MLIKGYQLCNIQIIIVFILQLFVKIFLYVRSRGYREVLDNVLNFKELVGCGDMDRLQVVKVIYTMVYNVEVKNSSCKGWFCFGVCIEQSIGYIYYYL